MPFAWHPTLALSWAGFMPASGPSRPPAASAPQRRRGPSPEAWTSVSPWWVWVSGCLHWLTPALPHGRPDGEYFDSLFLQDWIPPQGLAGWGEPSRCLPNRRLKEDRESWSPQVDLQTVLEELLGATGQMTIVSPRQCNKGLHSFSLRGGASFFNKAGPKHHITSNVKHFPPYTFTSPKRVDHPGRPSSLLKVRIAQDENPMQWVFSPRTNHFLYIQPKQSTLASKYARSSKPNLTLP